MIENNATYPSGNEKETVLWLSEGQGYQERGSSRFKGPEVGSCLRSFKVSTESAVARWREE